MGNLQNVSEVLSDSFSPAVILPEKDDNSHAHSIYYSQLRSAVKQLQRQSPFNRLKPGTAVTFLLPNGFEFLGVFFAIVGVRGVANPLNPNYSEDEIVFYLKDVEPRVIIVLKDAANVATVMKAANKVGVPVYEVSLELVARYGQQQPVRTAFKRLSKLLPPSSTISATNSAEAILTARPLDAHPDPLLSASEPPTTALIKAQHDHHGEDVALFLHTSGTTGRPKGVPLSHRNLLSSVANIMETYRLQPSDISYLVMPLFHVHGLIGVALATLFSGGTLVVSPKFSVSRFWKDFIAFKATWYSAVPTIHQMLLLKADETYPGNSGALRFIRSCSASLAPSVLLALEKRFHAPVVEAYAMTEAAHQMTSNYLPPQGRQPGSVGRGRGVQVQIFNDKGLKMPVKAVGEVCVSGKNVFAGYHNNPTANQESFIIDSNKKRWFRTGDLGYLDETRYLVLVGRIKEQINRGGEKISPVEVDQVFLQHPAVAEVVVFGVPDSVYGQAVEAAIVLKDTHKQITESALKEFVSSKLTSFKVPRKIYIVDQIPKTATGKIQRRVVSDHFVKQAKL